MLEAALGHRKLIDHALSENGMHCQKKAPNWVPFFGLKFAHSAVLP
ncbi:MAG: hypothetical protein RLZZ314_293 [Bacteroidota bacterium]|jgi:hypothetical protein